MFTAEREIAPGLDINGFIGGEIQRTTASFNTGQTSGGLSYPGNYFLANSVNEPISRGGIDYRRAFNSLYASARSEEHTSELQSLMRISYAVFCLKKKKLQHNTWTKTEND